jgi:biotin operon repressor
MRPKEAITEKELEVLLLLASYEYQTVEMIKRRLEKKVDKTTIWRRLESLKKKGFIDSDRESQGNPDPRGGRGEVKRYFILNYKYDEIYLELKKRGCKFTPVVDGGYVVKHRRHPDTFKYYPGETLEHYQLRTGFMGAGEALACKDSFPDDVRLVTDEEIALHIILNGCSQSVKDAEKASRELDIWIQ